jgi:hypothetical protein
MAGFELITEAQYLVGTGVTVLFVWRTIMLERLG